MGAKPHDNGGGVNERSGMMILVAGPYRCGTGDDPGRMAANVRAMEAYALPLFRAGHIPIIGTCLGVSRWPNRIGSARQEASWDDRSGT